MEPGDRWSPHAALRFADTLELGPGPAAFEARPRTRITFAGRGCVRELKQSSRQLAGPVGEILGARLPLEDGKDILRLKRRADAPSDRLRAGAAHHARAKPEGLGDRAQRALERVGGIGAAYLRRRPNRDVDDQMGRTGRDFLGQHRGDHLPDGIDIEHSFNADDHIVGRAEIDGAAPGDAAAFALDHLADGGNVEVDRCKHLHRVRRAGRRGDRPRRCLGHDQALRGHDRDDDRRGAIARQSTDAMLVDDDLFGPLQSLADIDHRPGQADRFVRIERDR